MSGCLSINRNLWKTSTVWLRPIIQITNLMNMLGVAIGPQIAAPFVGHYNGVPTSDTVNVTATVPNTTNGGIPPVQIAYFIVAGLDIGMVIVCMMTFAWSSITIGHCNNVQSMLFKEHDNHDEFQVIPDGTDTSSQGEGQPSQADTHLRPRLEPCSRLGCILLTFIFLIFFLNAGRDVLLTGLLFTYLFEYLKWPVYASTLLSTTFHLVRFFVAITVVLTTRWISPTALIIFDLASMLLASILMLLAVVVVGDGSIFTALGIIFTAVGDSNIHPTIIMLVEETIPVIAPVMALFVSAFGFSVVTIGPLAGISLHLSVWSFPLMLLAVTTAGVVFFVVYLITLRWVKSLERD